MVVDFIFDRLKSYAFDKNFKSDEFEAVLAVHPLSLYDFMQRLDAVKLFRQKPEGEALAAANKRIGNLLKKNDATSSLPQTIRLVEPVETDLLALAQQASQDIQPLLSRADYQATLERLAALKEPIDAFFENVMVMTDDLDLRQNRLALLDLLSTQFLTCADISKLQA
jgi:glycyl-tRNA synthetase beta chain